MADSERLWLAERTYSDDEQNLIILVYATTDGERYLRKERAMTSFSGPGLDVTAAVDADPDNVGTVDDEETRQRYATAAAEMARTHDPSDTI